VTESQTRAAGELFEQLTACFLADPTVRQGTGFGSIPGVRVGSKIFAMRRNSELVVKLSTQRVDQLVVSGIGARFDPRHDGRPLKEWVTIPARRGRDWEQLASEALKFVCSAVRSPAAADHPTIRAAPPSGNLPHKPQCGAAVASACPPER